MYGHIPKTCFLIKVFKDLLKWWPTYLNILISPFPPLLSSLLFPLSLLPSPMFLLLFFFFKESLTFAVLCWQEKWTWSPHVFFILFLSLFFHCPNHRMNFLFNNSHRCSLNFGKPKLFKNFQDGVVQLLGDEGNLKHPKVFKLFIFHMQS